MDTVLNPIKDIYERFDKLDCHINKLHEMINLEDRITASDVLCRLKVLEEKMDIHETSLNRKWIANSELSLRLAELERCIDWMKENDFNRNTYYLSQFKRIDEIVSVIDEIVDIIPEDDMREGRKPHKCPVCDGIGKNCVIGEIRGLPIKSDKCHSCEGNGIV
jgi:hypothetical protein